MSFYDDASLVLIPSGYKAGKVYSQKPLSTNGELTFTRASHATRVNAAGNVEKARTNYLLQSNKFDTTWALQGGATLLSGQTDKDGGTEAWQLTSSATTYSRVEQTISHTGVFTVSVYAKAGTLGWLAFENSGITSDGSYFDLTTGSIGTLGANVVDANIESVGSGWYRCSATLNGTSAVQRIYPATGDGDLNSATGNIYIQDAQLEKGLVATDYIETTTAAVTVGIYNDVPRLDYSGGSCPALLLEPQRTNLLPHSEHLTGYTIQNLSVDYNNIISPEGLKNAVKLTDNSTSGFHRLINSITTTAQDYTFSVYLKKGTMTDAYMQVLGGGNVARATFDLDAGTTYAISGSSKIEDAGSGWYRCSITGTANAGTTYCYLHLNGTSSYVGSGDYLYVYGWQFEEGSYATSYIPTYGSSVTRVKDTGADINLTPTGSKATIMIEVSGEDGALNRNLVAFRNGTTNQYGLYYFGAASNEFGFNTWNGDAYGITGSTIFDGSKHKIAAVFDFTDFTLNTLFIDGVKQTISQVKGTTLQRTAAKLSLIAPLNNQDPIQDIYKLLYFDSGLTDAQCIELTS